MVIHDTRFVELALSFSGAVVFGVLGLVKRVTHGIAVSFVREFISRGWKAVQSERIRIRACSSLY